MVSAFQMSTMCVLFCVHMSTDKVYGEGCLCMRPLWGTNTNFNSLQRANTILELMFSKWSF